jgi:phosphatidylserine/phosphatidylglycerophosphate/cardiolipin synthase-like enzyme
LWRIGAAHVTTENRVTLLRNGPATFDAMIARIATARARVSLESYIIHIATQSASGSRRS